MASRVPSYHKQILQAIEDPSVDRKLYNEIKNYSSFFDSILAQNISYELNKMGYTLKTNAALVGSSGKELRQVNLGDLLENMMISEGESASDIANILADIAANSHGDVSKKIMEKYGEKILIRSDSVPGMEAGDIIHSGVHAQVKGPNATLGKLYDPQLIFDNFMKNMTERKNSYSLDGLENNSPELYEAEFESIQMLDHYFSGKTGGEMDKIRQDLIRSSVDGYLNHSAAHVFLLSSSWGSSSGGAISPASLLRFGLIFEFPKNKLRRYLNTSNERTSPFKAEFDEKKIGNKKFNTGEFDQYIQKLLKARKKDTEKKGYNIASEKFKTILNGYNNTSTFPRTFELLQKSVDSKIDEKSNIVLKDLQNRAINMEMLGEIAYKLYHLNIKLRPTANQSLTWVKTALSEAEYGQTRGGNTKFESASVLLHSRSYKMLQLLLKGLGYRRSSEANQGYFNQFYEGRRKFVPFLGQDYVDYYSNPRKLINK